MKHLLTLVVALCAVTFAFGQHTGHPRLFFTASDIPQIISRINQSGSAASQLYGEVVEQSNYYNTNWLWDYDQFPHNKAAFYTGLPSIAFRYIVTGDIQWATRAKYMIFNTETPFYKQGIIYDDWYTKLAANPLGRMRAISQQVIVLSILYDWLYDQLDASQRGQIQQKIIDNIALTYPWEIYGGGIRFVFTREDTNRMRYEHPTEALLLGAMSIYGENAGYPTSQADNDIATALNYQFRNPQSYVNRYFSPYDGSEPSGTSYPLWWLRFSVSMLEAWSHWDGVNHWNDTNIRDRFSKFGDWLAYEVLPDPKTWPCMFNTLNDSYSQQYGSMGLLLALSAKYPEKAGLNQWVFNHTIQNVQNLLYNAADMNFEQEILGASMDFIFPILAGFNFVSPVEPSTVLPLSRNMTWIGEVDIKTSQVWGDANDIQFTFTSEPALHPQFGYNYHHDHPDKNHFTLSAFGDLYLRGYGYDGQAPEYHNTVLIDGKGEAYAGFLSGLTSQGQIVQHATSSQFDFIHGDATLAYNELNFGVGKPPEVYTITNPGPASTSSFNPVQWAQRYITFSRAMDNIPAYFIVADDIQKDGNTHTFSWRFHSAKARSGSNPVRLTGTGGNYLDMWFASTSSLSQTEMQLPQDKSGQREMFDALVPAWNTICDYPTATDKSTLIPVINPYFHVALVPHKSGYPIPSYATTSINNGSLVSLVWPNGYTDFSIFKYQNSLQTSGQGVVTDAKLSRIRVVTSSGVVSSYLAAEGTTLAYNGQELINLYSLQGTVMRCGTSVDIFGSSISSFRVYSPNNVSVKINGTEVGFVQVGDYVESNNVSVNRTWSGNISSNYPVTVSATLRIDPGSIFKIGYGWDITVNGKLVATGTESQRITFTSTNSTPAAGDWQGIVCSGGGPDTLTYCNIKYAYDGLRLMNTAANSYMQNDTISRSANYGLFVSNTGTASTSLKMYKCGVSYNDGRAVQVNNAKVLVSYTRVDNNELQSIGVSNVYVCNGGKVYMDSTRIQNNIGSGIDISGTNSRVSLSINEVNKGYNTVTQSGVGEIYVHNSATAFLGYLGSGGPIGGWNNVYNNGTYTGRLINNATTTTVRARYTYWGTHRPNEYVGPVDTLYQLGSAVNTPSKTVFTLPEEGLLAYDLDRQEMLDWLKQLKNDIEANRDNAEDAFYQLALHAGPGGEYQSVLALSWETFLSAIETSTLPAKLKMLAVGLRLQSMLDQNQFRSAITLSNQILSQKGVTTDMWLYCQTRKIFASVGMGDSLNAWAIFNGIRDYSRMIDSSAIKTMEEYLTLTMGLNNGKVANVNNPFENNNENTDGIKPTAYSLVQNYPNPFNPVTLIQYGLPEQSHVTLKIYDILGREVRTLVNEVQEAGYRSIMFDASSIPSGVYFYRIQAGKFVDMKKMILLR